MIRKMKLFGRWGHSVGNQLFAIFLVGIIGFVLLTGYASYYNSQNILRDKLTEASKQTIRQANEKLDLAYNQYDEKSEQLVINSLLLQDIRAFLNPDMPETDRALAKVKIQTKINEFVSVDDNLVSVQLYGADGRWLLSGRKTAAQTDVSGEPWFADVQKLNGEPKWLGTQAKGYSSDGEEATFALTRTLGNQGAGEFLGVMLFEMKLDVVAKMLGAVQIGDGGVKMVLSETGGVVYDSRSPSDPAGASASLMLNHIGATTEDTGFVYLQDESGITNAVVYSRSEKTGWLTAAYVPVSHFLRETRTIWSNTLLIAGLSLVLAAVMGLWMARRYGRPLIRLRELMRAGENGNLQVRMQIRRKDEIGQLADSFDGMMSRITELVQSTAKSAYLVQSTSGELMQVSHATAESARQMSRANREIASGSAGLSSETEKVSEMAGDTTSRMETVLQKSVQMEQSAEELRQAGLQGQTFMLRLKEQTAQVEEKSRSMLENVERLKEGNQSVRKIMDKLNDIVKRTNILSLNASIEAHRSGQAGKGFMVVAEEIRKLAEQSRLTIEGVGDVTNGIQTDIESTARLMAETYPVLRTQSEYVRSTDEIFLTIRERQNGFLEDLSHMANVLKMLERSQLQLAEAMENVSAVSEQSYATSEEVAAQGEVQLQIGERLVRLSEQLAELSAGLNLSIGKFDYE